MSSSIKSLLAIFGLALCGCGSNGTPVHIVVPNGFKGEVRLVLDGVHGTEVKPSQGRYEYRIPASGILRVTSFGPFKGWHVQTAAYEDGTVLEPEVETVEGPHGEKPRLGKDVVVFCGGSVGQKNHEAPVMTYFVGSVVEYEKWQQERLQSRLCRKTLYLVQAVKCLHRRLDKTDVGSLFSDKA